MRYVWAENEADALNRYESEGVETKEAAHLILNHIQFGSSNHMVLYRVQDGIVKKANE